MDDIIAQGVHQVESDGVLARRRSGGNSQQEVVGAVESIALDPVAAAENMTVLGQGFSRRGAHLQPAAEIRDAGNGIQNVRSQGDRLCRQGDIQGGRGDCERGQLGRIGVDDTRIDDRNGRGELGWKGGALSQPA